MQSRDKEMCRMAETSSDHIPLPESLVKQLRAFEKRLLRMETLVAVLGALCGLLLTYGILFIADRLTDTPVWARVALTLSGSVVCAACCWVWLHHWWWRRRDTRELAKLIQKQHRRLGDRLLGVVELANGASAPAAMSPAICRAAIRQVAEESARYDFQRAVSTRWPQVTMMAFLVLALLVLVPVFLFPQAGCNALTRWWRPLGHVARYTFVSVEAMPDSLVVPHGEEFEIGCALAPGSRWRPPRATCRIAKLPPIENSVQDGKFWFHLPGMTRDTSLTIRLGDLVKTIRIKPMFRPELMRMEAVVSLPAYLGRPPVVARIEGGREKFLTGSRLRLVGTVSRALQSATVKSNGEQRVTVHSNEFVLADLEAGALSNGYAITWTDIHGLSAAAPYVLHTTAQDDEAPRVEIRGVDRVIAILEDEVVKFDLRAEDDYGIREMWVNWNNSSGKGQDAAAMTGTQTIGKGAPDCLELEGTFAFSPIACHVPEETEVILCAYATDYLPGRKPALSAVHRIHVLSRAEHAKLIREQMDALHARIEDRVREEERLLEKNRELGKLTPAQLAEDRHTADLKESQAAEKENAEQTAQLSKEAWALLKEAMRNQAIAEATLRQWAELAQAMGDLSQNEMQAAAQSLGQAAANAAQRADKLNEAMRQEELILQAMQQMERQANRAIEDMQARGFVNRLLQVAAQELLISQGLQGVLPEIAGIAPADIPAGKKKELDQLAQRQEGACKEAGNIRDDLLGFYNRTRVPKYNNVHADMIARRAGESLRLLTEQIRANTALQTIEEAAVWSKQFTVWAELLRKKKDGAGGEGGEGGGEEQEPDAADIEVMIGLMRARQREEGLREQTRLVEDGKAKNERYPADAKKLCGLQNEITADVRTLEGRATDADLRRLVEVVGGEMMNVAVMLRRPQTDAETIAIETYIIELLANETSGGSGGKGGGKAGGKASAMAGKMQKGMGAGGGKTGGGSTAGGTTDKANMATGAGGSGEAPETRNVDKTGGAAGAAWPEEFREALENYFKHLEEKK